MIEGDMMNDNYSQGIEYEKLTQSVYKQIIAQESIKNVDVFHDEDIEGRSKVKHQIDVWWKFKVAGIDHLVLVECKHHNNPLTLGRVRDFFGVIHDIGAKGVMVTKVGFQSGANDFAKHYGIDLKLLRKPREEDWEGRIKDVKVKISLKVPVHGPDHVIQADFGFTYESEAEKERINNWIEKGEIDIPDVPNTRLCDKDGHEITEELGLLIPRELNYESRTAGGPYTEKIPFTDNEYYVSVTHNNGEEVLIQLAEIEVEYWVEEIRDEFVIYGEEIVSHVLQDYASGKIEHFFKPE